MNKDTLWNIKRDQRRERERGMIQLSRVYKFILVSLAPARLIQPFEGFNFILFLFQCMLAINFIIILPSSLIIISIILGHKKEKKLYFYLKVEIGAFYIWFQQHCCHWPEIFPFSTIVNKNNGKNETIVLINIVLDDNVNLVLFGI